MNRRECKNLGNYLKIETRKVCRKMVGKRNDERKRILRMAQAYDMAVVNIRLLCVCV